LEPECPLSYGNIRVFSIFRLRASNPYAIVIHGKGTGPRTKSATLRRPHPTDGNTHQRITTMAAMKKKKKAKKAAKKST
jgi:hypothetical protein